MLKETKVALSFCLLLLRSCSKMFAETITVLTYFHQLSLTYIISLDKIILKATNFVKTFYLLQVLQRLLFAQLLE